MADETRIVVIRHGESNAQRARILSGHATCTGLSPDGRSQVASLRDRLVRTGEIGPVDAVYTSLLPRAIETAEILRPALGLAVTGSECEWCEIHAGEAEGMGVEAMVAKYHPEGGPMDPHSRAIPGAENWADAVSRMRARLERAAAEHRGRTVVVAGHGGTVGASFAAFADADLLRCVDVAHTAINASITEWSSTGARWRLVRFNDAGHVGG